MFDEFDILLNDNLFEKNESFENIELQEGDRREVAILFADLKGFTSLSEKLDPEQLHILIDKLMKIFTLCIQHYGGFVDKYEGDKIMALFGAKIASEKDSERAIRAALEMLKRLEQYNELLSKNVSFSNIKFNIRIGINTGIVTTGRIGAKREGDFTVYGEAVNLASRMESNAPENRILVSSETHCLVSHIFEFEDGSKIQLKGLSEPVSTAIVVGIKKDHVPRWLKYRTPFIGRRREYVIIKNRYDRFKEGLESLLERQNNLRSSEDTANQKAIEDTIPRNCKPVVVGIKAPAGAGKSRIIAEFLKNELSWNPQIDYDCADENTLEPISPAVWGRVPQFVQRPYGLFIDLIKKILRIKNSYSQDQALSGINSFFYQFEGGEEANIKQVKSIVRLLLGHPDENLLKLNQETLQQLIRESVCSFVKLVAGEVISKGHPFILICDDVQWIDASSQSTLKFLFQTLRYDQAGNKLTLGIFFILSFRPFYNVSENSLADINYYDLELSPLSEAECEILLAKSLKPLTMVDFFTKTIIEKSEGNPFFMEEWGKLIKDILLNLSTAGDLRRPDTSTHMVPPIPRTLQSLVLSRIDRLESDKKLILQKSSVIGNSFSVQMLLHIEHELKSKSDTISILKALEAAGYIYRENDFCNFQHKTTQEIAYNTLLISNRKIIHGIIARNLEETHSQNVNEVYPELAHHFDKADIEDKAIYYLTKAIEQAKFNYEHKQSRQLMNRLIARYEDNPDYINQYFDILGQKADIYNLTGKWDKCITLLNRILNHAEVSADENRLASIQMKIGWAHYQKGSYADAMDYFLNAFRHFKSSNDRKGLAIALHHIGTVHGAIGEYSPAMSNLQEAYSINKELGNKLSMSKNLGNIGIIHLQEGNFPAAVDCSNQQISLCEELSHSEGIANATGNKGILFYYSGNYDEARKCYLYQLQVNKELGIRNGVSDAHNNLGILMSTMQRYREALRHFDISIKIARDIGSKYHLSRGLVEKGEVLYQLQHYSRAGAITEEGIAIAREIKLYEYEFKGEILLARISRASGKYEEALRQLNDLMSRHHSDFSRAPLHFELFQLSKVFRSTNLDTEYHRGMAITKYNNLYRKTKKVHWNKQLEILSHDDKSEEEIVTELNDDEDV
ncbi:adenylate/guanylate cyclase domain-containing protein [candidate division CSSED10-310 bacterium]|uniref:Adenylate/guanylate cyclase domain-containing protein n=1 Tax=candidate division CSSED10-310 bacterium TaxID=2855610 RepID=A0ABV6YX07_UNCC1